MSFIERKKIFYVNSANRNNGTDSDFTYVFDLLSSDIYDKVTVLQMIIPKSYYLIQEGYNTFTLVENGVNIIITIPVGNYNRRSFQSVVQNILTSSSLNNWIYTISYSNSQTQTDNGKYTYNVSGNSSQPQFIFNTNLYEPMGFNKNSTNVFVGNNLVSTNVIKLQAEDTLYLHSDVCTNGNDSVLQEIFASTGEASYANIHFENYAVESYAKNLVSNHKNIYRFYLTDENDQPINLNGQNFQFTIMFYKENNIYKLIKEFLKFEISQK